MFLLKMLVCVLLVCVAVVECYPNGQVSAACGSLMPNHGSNNAQTSAAPYNVTVDKTVFKEGDQVTVTLNSQSGYVFKGFMLQANLVGSTDPIGNFSVANSSVQTIPCNGVASKAVSHTSGSKKTTIQATWTAPTSGQLGNMEFRATFVRNDSIYWVGVKSAAVTYNGTGLGTSSTTFGPTVPSNPDYGTSKICFSQPSGCDPTTSTGCYFMAVQTSADQSQMRIEMFGQAAGYIAIGFSDDQKMGNDDIYICSKDSSNNLQVQHAFSTAKSTPKILPLGNVTNIVTALTNGNINCSFTSRNIISTGTRAASTNQYYLMIASGTSSQGNIQIHTNTFVSSTKANILSPGVVATDVEKFPPIVKAHGCLMLISWMTTGSIGMLIARYLKAVAKDHGCLGKDFWFIAHVCLMSLSITATAIAFIIVFSYAQDWSGGAHPVLGCLVMIFTLIQPIVAAFRCDPQHERRFVFNWAHSFIALAIKGLAVAAIFTGLGLFEGNEDGWMRKVMGGFVAWEAVMYILQDLNMRAKKKETEIFSCGSIKPETGLLILYILGNLAFLIALLYGIGSY